MMKTTNRILESIREAAIAAYTDSLSFAARNRFVLDECDHDPASYYLPLGRYEGLLQAAALAGGKIDDGPLRRLALEKLKRRLWSSIGTLRGELASSKAGPEFEGATIQALLENKGLVDACFSLNEAQETLDVLLALEGSGALLGAKSEEAPETSDARDQLDNKQVLYRPVLKKSGGYVFDPPLGLSWEPFYTREIANERRKDFDCGAYLPGMTPHSELIGSGEVIVAEVAPEPKD